MSIAMQGQVACLEAMRGNFALAWSLLGDVLSTLEDLGQAVGWVPWVTHREDVAFVASLQGDRGRAERALRLNHVELERTGATVLLSTQAALLADLACGRGDIDEADRLVALSRRLTTADDVLSQLLWRRVWAKVLAHRGQTRKSVEISDEAIRIAERTDALNIQADTWMDHAEVLRIAGDRRKEIRFAVEQALDRYTRKGNLVSSGRARRLLTDADIMGDLPIMGNLGG
jgi:ATP/maltotriose-dependent transcriptional regulator MalT